MIITIASGKGDTGKTTVGTSLALSLAAESLLFWDCVVQDQLVETEYGDHRFYLRKLRGWKDRD